MDSGKQLENKMVLNSELYWPDEKNTVEVKDEKPEPGYYSTKNDDFVPEADAWDYVMDHVSECWDDFKDAMTEWYFSGNWVHKK